MVNDWVLAHTGAAVTDSVLLQNLWGGYGELRRLYLQDRPSVILKCVLPPAEECASVSDRRKRRSYEVEQAWYQGPARHSQARLAACLATGGAGETRLLLLEDLANAGFKPGRPPQVGAGLRWLARFHASFLDARPAGVWEQGGYWHLDTRQEEFQRMPAGPLKEAARALDLLLKKARYQTLLHGDSKPANFLWKNSAEAAAVDFQYVGAGCGIRDVAYFLDCCASSSQVESWLDFYFRALQEACPDLPEGLEAEWRRLYPVAWADYARFMQGWGRPGPLDDYGRQQLRRALALL
ncbi:MAG: phosphotransferase [Candidatus Eremiobacteraeota bacterium]|nr:phosphotransferase [Candidatus Eremiobacteraeota bacterium]MCW5871585.1 phosphotransferase [Candidatus Eremiobacteraeota bacterium]